MGEFHVGMKEVFTVHANMKLTLHFKVDFT